MSTMRDIFNQIAPGWYNFRHWSIFRTELEALALRWQWGRLLNIGCAHGPDFLPFKESFELHGADFSTEMLKLAQKYSKKFKFTVSLMEADIRQLLKDKEDRLKALQELWRVIKPGGEAFITVWNHWQPRFWFRPKSLLVPWRTRDKTLYRYYYLFSYHELERLVKKAGFEVLKSFPESTYHLPVKTFSRNICLLMKKRT